MEHERASRAVDVLLVEDHPADAWLVREVLKQSRISNRLHTVGSAGEAMAYLRKQGPYRQALDAELVLLSAGLPNGDTARVLEGMSADKRLSSVVVVVMGDSNPEALKACYQSALAFVAKPFELRGLIDALGQTDKLGLAVVQLSH